METTIDLPDDLLQQAMEVAERRYITLNELIIEALELVIQEDQHGLFDNGDDDEK